MITFSKALEETEGKDRALLTGNGFSIAQTHGRFSYANLLEKSKISKESPLRDLFARMRTVDFEQIIQLVEHAKIVAETYDQPEFSKSLARDSEKIRESLIDAIHTVHPDSFASLTEDELATCATFLKSFKEVYTLNYDLLLYWVNLHGKIYADGFGLGETHGNFRGPFNEDGYCHIYNIHGGLHLFLNHTREVEKLVATTGNLMDEIGDEIRSNKRLPIFVAEGDTEEKLNKIRSIPYLDYCYKKLHTLRGSLFVVGHSANERDAHIYNALFASELNSIYFCVHDPEENLDEIRQRLSPYRTSNESISVQFIDGKTLNIWGS